MGVSKAIWAGIHGELGCKGCKFADKKKLNSDACCTFPTQILTLADRSCTKRREGAGGDMRAKPHVS